MFDCRRSCIRLFGIRSAEAFNFFLIRIGFCDAYFIDKDF